MRVGLITYDCGHLKTEQVAERLAEQGHALTFFGFPFTPRPSRAPLFEHRPDQFRDRRATAELARRFGGDYVGCQSDADVVANVDICMVMIGVLLPPRLLARAPVLNCHAGVVPLVRGLDAFKWAIMDDQPLGVSLHFIDAEVDAGDVVAVVPTPVKADDSIEVLAVRHYENEIETSANFERHLSAPTNPFASSRPREARKRMPIETEKAMLALFPAYRDRWAS